MTRATFFWFPWSVAALVAAVVLYFFVAGVADGSVSSSNILLWMGILAVVTAVIGGSLWLRFAGRPVLGMLLTLVLAGPGLLAALFMLVVLITNPRWN